MKMEEDCKTIDMHCDTLMKAYFDYRNDIFDVPEYDLDIKRMISSGMMAQFLQYLYHHQKYMKDLIDHILVMMNILINVLIFLIIQ